MRLQSQRQNRSPTLRGALASWLIIAALGNAAACGATELLAAPDASTPADTDARAPEFGTPLRQLAFVNNITDANSKPFRVCFETFGSSPPLPRGKTMPLSNQVGIDIGSGAFLDFDADDANKASETFKSAGVLKASLVWLTDPSSVDAPCSELLTDASASGPHCTFDANIFSRPHVVVVTGASAAPTCTKISTTFNTYSQYTTRFSRLTGQADAVKFSKASTSKIALVSDTETSLSTPNFEVKDFEVAAFEFDATTTTTTTTLAAAASFMTSKIPASQFYRPKVPMLLLYLDGAEGQGACSGGDDPRKCPHFIAVPQTDPEASDAPATPKLDAGSAVDARSDVRAVDTGLTDTGSSSTDATKLPDVSKG
jgi:hypothetical protein